MRLLVVESPAKARTLQRMLGGDTLVRATSGHIRDLPARGLGVVPEKGYRVQTRLLPAARRELAALKQEAMLCREILIATDPDREGEGLARDLADALGPLRKQVTRVRLGELTPGAVEAALEAGGSVDHASADAQLARRVVDRLIGYTVSPALTNAVGVSSPLSAGRTQSVALHLICERERERNEPVAAPAYDLALTCPAPDGSPLLGRLGQPCADRLATKRTAERLQGARLKLTDVRVEPVVVPPPSGLTTDRLIERASDQFGLGAREVMWAAQALFEGIELGDGVPVGLVSYPRSDDDRLPGTFAGMAEAFIRNRFGAHLAHGPRNSDRHTGHGAIRPIDPERTPDSLRPFLTPAQFRTYGLIWESALRSCSVDARDLSLSADAETPDGRERIVISEIRASHPGFRAIVSTGEPFSVPGEPLSPADRGLAAGTELTVQAAWIVEQRPSPPPHHTDGSLVAALRARGVGRPSTYVGAVETPIERGYARRIAGSLEPTALGLRVDEALATHFPDLLDPEFTARLERALDRIAAGEASFADVVSTFHRDWVVPASAKARTARPRPR